ncbi:hypothetical protein DFH07DRAFT_834234 [Mycena maculata]|uniref:DUF6699 domain-containing protein n=1 Tax=Mycena maculata TaxID=230809 RepID=A0AAD7IL80_9AGAR|nr:hypothetical protein DFH07DRAFT_834234 [Mycena maculata]
MRKNVHFSSTNISYSPVPWSPSSTASTSSLPPSPDPLLSLLPDESTPKDEPRLSVQEVHGKPVSLSIPIIYSPWPAPSLLRISPRQQHLAIPTSPITQIHLLLSFMPFTPPNVHYDLAHPLHTINPQLTPSFLDPATFPPLPALSVLCRHINWPILVSPSRPGGFVSVLDVFTSVYASLRLAVRRAEYDALPSGDARHSVDNAYFARCRAVADENERQIETLKGVKRVDFLMGRTQFLGLSGPLEAAHTWELNVS